MSTKLSKSHSQGSEVNQSRCLHPIGHLLHDSSLRKTPSHQWSLWAAGVCLSQCQPSGHHAPTAGMVRSYRHLYGAVVGACRASARCCRRGGKAGIAGTVWPHVRDVYLPPALPRAAWVPGLAGDGSLRLIANIAFTSVSGAGPHWMAQLLSMVLPELRLCRPEICKI